MPKIENSSVTVDDHDVYVNYVALPVYVADSPIEVIELESDFFEVRLSLLVEKFSDERSDNLRGTITYSKEEH